MPASPRVRIIVRIGNRADEVRAMGCDIHAMMERRVEEHGDWDEWVNAGAPRCDDYRDYLLFACLADVRNFDGEVPIHAPRGCARDVNAAYSAWRDRWSGDAHHESWATLTEVRAYAPPPSLHRAWAELIEDMERVKRLGDTDDDVRLVFFFEG